VSLGLAPVLLAVSFLFADGEDRDAGSLLDLGRKPVEDAGWGGAVPGISHLNSHSRLKPAGVEDTQPPPYDIHVARQP
jgi:hypothetical protein